MPHAALRTILPVAGWSAARADAVTFTGGTDPILPTPFRIGVAGYAFTVWNLHPLLLAGLPAHGQSHFSIGRVDW